MLFIGGGGRCELQTLGRCLRTKGGEEIPEAASVSHGSLRGLRTGPAGIQGSTELHSQVDSRWSSLLIPCHSPLVGEEHVGRL